jgi:aspartyl-tRNA(Asn)/glutamyl-tRNA(Gln) amidotransferase subunit A
MKSRLRVPELVAADPRHARSAADRYRERIRVHNPRLNAFITQVDPEVPPAAGPLAGVPIAHKDIFVTRGIRTTCGSRMLADFIPPYDATVVERLARAGCILVGKTNMDEFAMGSSNETSAFGPVRNPWDPERVPGGSSGGSAAAVAAGLVPVATGTDTGGSIRQPAALCGVTGFKPSYGRVSRFGMIAFASSMDQAGVLARSAEDVAWVLRGMAGHDPRDSTSVDRPVPDYVAALTRGIRGLRIGIVRNFFDDGLWPTVADRIQAALAVLEAAGARLTDVTLPNLSLSVPVYYVLAPAECSSNLARYDGVRFGHRADRPEDLFDLYCRSRSEGFGEEVQRRILIGTYVLSHGYYDAYYLKAQRVRRLIRNDFLRAFESVDLLAGPTTPTPAFRLGEKTADPLTMYLNDIYTIGVNLAGLPALSVPAGLVDGLPVGLQLIGRDFDEETLFAAAADFQRRTEWHRAEPPGFEDVSG